MASDFRLVNWFQRNAQLNSLENSQGMLKVPMNKSMVKSLKAEGAGEAFSLDIRSQKENLKGT